MHHLRGRVSGVERATTTIIVNDAERRIEVARRTEDDRLYVPIQAKYEIRKESTKLPTTNSNAMSKEQALQIKQP